MPIHNSDIVENFNKVVDLLEIKGANPLRVRAYRNAARTIGGLDILVSVKRGSDIIAHFVNYDDVDHVIFKKNIKGHI